MKAKHLFATVLAVTLATGSVATAQTSTETTVSTDTGVKNGVPTKTTKVVHVRKHKTHHVKKILGVKVGHKTRVTKTVKETTTDANGGKSTTVKTSNK